MEMETTRVDGDDVGDNEGIGGVEHRNINKTSPLPLSMVVRRLLDDDRLNDECWNSEVRYCCGRTNGWAVSLFELFHSFLLLFCVCLGWFGTYAYSRSQPRSYPARFTDVNSKDHGPVLIIILLILNFHPFFALLTSANRMGQINLETR